MLPGITILRNKDLIIVLLILLNVNQMRFKGNLNAIIITRNLKLQKHAGCGMSKGKTAHVIRKMADKGEGSKKTNILPHVLWE